MTATTLASYPQGSDKPIEKGMIMDALVQTDQDLGFVWLEITGRCQLECVHCYAESGPAGTHGQMSRDDWRRVIDEAAALGAGMVQFIGGEPTLHPDLEGLIAHARGAGVEVEVFSNLVHAPARLWEVFGAGGVRLACSYYSDNPEQHAAITGRNTYMRTKANIVEALARSIPLRVGVIDLGDTQRTRQATAELAELGVSEIGHDVLRGVGRGVRTGAAGVEQLCGNCTNGVLAISPSGEVWPCVFSRWLPIGNVLTESLPAIISGERFAQVRHDLDQAFQARERRLPCVPRMCDPQCGPSCGPSCKPSCWPTGSGPCTPKGGCTPNYGGKPKGDERPDPKKDEKRGGRG